MIYLVLGILAVLITISHFYMMSHDQETGDIENEVDVIDPDSVDLFPPVMEETILNPESATPQGPITNEKGDPNKIGLVIGINKVSEFVYGDDMPLKGCVNDSNHMKDFLVSKGFGKIYQLTDANATINNFLKTWREIVATVKDGDTIFLSMSRHGASIGQDVMDKDPETEGKNKDGTMYKGDQGAVMYDGFIVDDCFWRLFSTLPKVKLIYLNDSCHSATQYKVTPGKRKGKYARPKTIPPEYLPQKDRFLMVNQLDKVFPKTKEEPKFDLISLSGCQDHEYSLDAYLNRKYQGAFTCYFLEYIKNNPKATPEEIKKEVTKTLHSKELMQSPEVRVEGDKSLMQQPLL